MSNGDKLLMYSFLDEWQSCSCSTLKSVEFIWMTNWWSIIHKYNISNTSFSIPLPCTMWHIHWTCSLCRGKRPSPFTWSCWIWTTTFWSALTCPTESRGLRSLNICTWRLRVKEASSKSGDYMQIPPMTWYALCLVWVAGTFLPFAQQVAPLPCNRSWGWT